VFEVVVDVNGNIVDTYTSSATVLSSLNFTVNSKFDTTTGKRTLEAEADGFGGQHRKLGFALIAILVKGVTYVHKNI
jgi:hypothetical protein